MSPTAYFFCCARKSRQKDALGDAPYCALTRAIFGRFAAETPYSGAGLRPFRWLSVPANVLHAVIDRLHQFRFCSFPEYLGGYNSAQQFVGADAHIGPANIVHHRRIRRWPAISTAACFAISLRGNCYRWERCLHAGGAVVQFCRQFIVCWPQCSSTELFCDTAVQSDPHPASLFAYFF